MLKTIFQSSLDPSKISLTVQALTKCAIFIAGYFAVSKGFNPMEATTAIEQIGDIVISLIPAVLAVYHGGEAIYGLVRKMFVQK